MKRIILKLAAIAAALPILASCENMFPWNLVKDKSDDYDTNVAVGYFAANTMSVYYLWENEISSGLEAWMGNLGGTDPKAEVSALRYSSGGRLYDRWTELTDDYESLTSSFQGVTTTYGCSVVLKRAGTSGDDVLAIITVVYAGSPAEQAGLKRGDVISTVGGVKMTLSNYYELITDKFLYSANCSLGVSGPSGSDVRTVNMTAVTMYEDPVVYSAVYPVGDKKVGYLFYTSFTIKSIPTLLEVCRSFKAAGISELILDLRYNGGGYVLAEMVLASIFAPEANVNARDVFEMETYNAALTNYYISRYGEDALNTRFSTEFSYTDDGEEKTVDTKGLNLGLNKIYAIIDSGSASASESLLVGLMPYMDVVLVGGNSHGKFCSGITYGADEWYEDYEDQIPETISLRKDLAKNWGIYVMIGSYADKNGNNPCRPEGLFADYPVEDVPENGLQIGDEMEPMLRKALSLAGKTDLEAAYTRSGGSGLEQTSRQVRPAVFGKRILPQIPEGISLE